MNVYQYFSVTNGANARAFGFAFEHPAPDLDKLSKLLSEDGLLTVTKLKSAEDGRGGRLITGRERIIIGLASVATIQLAAVRHWEATDVEAAA
ncbi:hypothetical protein [Beijerinckia sp. L45]|uniref:hypothetical protein n=1 Tax=Beijerinckia sp. L45 TaxID=1641855 RepID=UPI00131D001D|nr:hypothetical protein [Beijerinckia sp. L45]